MIANPTNATKPGGLLCRRPLEGVKPDPVAAATPATPLHWPGKQPAPTSGRPLQHCRAMLTPEIARRYGRGEWRGGHWRGLNRPR